MYCDLRNQEMDINDCAKILLDRIRLADPGNANKIISYLLANCSYAEIMRYAHFSEQQILSVILEARSFLKATRQFSQSLTLPLSPSPGNDSPVPYWESQVLPNKNVNGLQYPISPNCPIGALENSIPESVGLREQFQSLSIPGDGMLANYLSTCLNGIEDPLCRPDSPTRPCHYFSRGFCKNGANCRFFHGAGVPEVQKVDHAYSFVSSGKLEMEIRELLMSRGGMPVSIAMLPMLYHEKYGKILQAEGYLTESQRQGKAGCSLTRLLLWFKTIRVIERPHGQHAVVLVEDAHKYLVCMADGCNVIDDGGSSNQIYLTFPAESTFTDEHIRNYFKQFGPVFDVRIPRQEKRMFGFVGFLYPETVRLILAKGSPHFICGARVLVKPYKEKPKPNGRKHSQKYAHFNFFAHRMSDVVQEHHNEGKLSSHCESILEKPDRGCDIGFDIERKNSVVLEQASAPLTHVPSFGCVQEVQTSPEGDQGTELSHVMDELDDGSSAQDSSEFKLPESLGLY